MAAIAIDTHEFFNQLKNVGFSIEQAEVIAQMQKATSKATFEQVQQEFALDDVVTNKSLDARIKESEFKLESRIKDTEIKIAESKAELVRWVIGAGFLQVALIAGLVLKLAEKI